MTAKFSNDHKDDRKLSLLIERKVTSIQTGTKDEKAAEIRRAIEFNLRNWLKGVESIDPKYRVSELIQVGSYAEGTKIIQPDEFDFLAVIEELSKPGAVVTASGEDRSRCNLVTVALADDSLKSKWSTLCKDGNLQCFQRVNFPDVGQERFGHVVISYLKKKVRELYKTNTSSRKGYGSPFEIYCNIRLPTENSVSLVFKGAVYKTPNIFIEFEVGNMEVTVDLSPAIRYYKIDDCFNVENCCGQAFADLVLCRNSLLLVGTDKEADFKVTVTEAEVEYMRSVMKQEHRLIYIFLKFINNSFTEGITSFEAYTSYILKTVCIHHDIKCTSEQRSLTVCFKSVIEDLDECRRKEYVVSAVDRRLHLYIRPYPYPEDRLDDNRKCMLEGILKMFQLSEEVDSVENFDEFLNNLVQQEEQRRNEEEQRLYLLQKSLEEEAAITNPVFQKMEQETESPANNHAPANKGPSGGRHETGSGKSETSTTGQTSIVLYTRT